MMEKNFVELCSCGGRCICTHLAHYRSIPMADEALARFELRRRWGDEGKIWVTSTAALLKWTRRRTFLRIVSPREAKRLVLEIDGVDDPISGRETQELLEAMAARLPILTTPAGDAALVAKICAKVSRFTGFGECWRELTHRRRIPGYVKRSLHRRKFVVQNFIAGLTHDFKVLAYGKKYYVVRRENRTGDFRASGSGLLSWPDEPPAGLLDFARKVFGAFDVPTMSMDIALDGKRFHLIEGQFVHFGAKVIQESTHYFTPSEPGWRKVVGPSVLEEEFASCVADFLKRADNSTTC